MSKPTKVYLCKVFFSNGEEGYRIFGMDHVMYKSNVSPEDWAKLEALSYDRCDKDSEHSCKHQERRCPECPFMLLSAPIAD